MTRGLTKIMALSFGLASGFLLLIVRIIRVLTCLPSALMMSL